MKVPLSWLKDYVDINVSPKDFAHELTMSGSKVEGIEVQGEDIVNVVVGKILSLEKHPEADKLQVSKVDVGNEVIQVITGAQNVKVGDCVPVALSGALLPGGKKITKGKLRGLESNGMMCSIAELNLTKADYPEAEEDGIFILDPNLTPGTDIKDVLGLNDTVFEFEITPNRPDCLSMIGIAREAAVTLKSNFRKPEIKVKEEAGDHVSAYASVEIKDADLCSRYTARVVKDVKIEPSPEWMRRRLKAAGIRPINNIVDITNYVMLEMGQPMHAFDLKNIKGSHIIVRRAADGEVLRTLDGQERKLDSSILVIADAERPVGIAGVMGGENSEITENTQMILFESANFDGTSIRLTSKKLGLRSEASSRFEKGLDVENTIAALERAVQLVEELGAGKVCKGIIDCYPNPKKEHTILLRPDRINALLGTEIPAEDMIEILEALEFKIDKENMIVTVPSFRADVEREADIAEEIARFYGYNNIEATLLSGKAQTQGIKTYKQKIEDIIYKTMLACGLSETYTFSFTGRKVFDKINLPSDSKLRDAVVISNPLGEDFKIMRTTTIPDMLDVISRNYNRRVEEARFFELSYVYFHEKPDYSQDSSSIKSKAAASKNVPENIYENEKLGKLPYQEQVLTIGMYGNTDYYELKGIVEELMDSLGIKEYSFEPEKENPTYHPGRTAKVFVNGIEAGIIGEIHPDVSERFEAPERTYIGTIKVGILIENTSMLKQYKELPKFPAITRDIAMLVPDEILVRQIESVIKQRAGKNLESIKLFDVYKGSQVPEGKKSVAYSISFRAADRTLTDDEVNKYMAKILDGLKTLLGAELR